METITDFSITVTNSDKTLFDGKHEYTEIKYHVLIVTNHIHNYKIELSINNREVLYLLVLEDDKFSSSIVSWNNQNTMIDFYNNNKVESDLESLNEYYRKKYIGATLTATSFSTGDYDFTDFIVDDYNKYGYKEYYRYQMDTDRGILTFVPNHNVICGYSLGWCILHKYLPLFSITEKNIETHTMTISIYCKGCNDGYRC